MNISTGWPAAAFGVVMLACGIAIGRSRNVNVTLPGKMDWQVTRNPTGTERVACLDWMANHFESPTIAELEMVCGSGAVHYEVSDKAMPTLTESLSRRGR